MKIFYTAIMAMVLLMLTGCAQDSTVDAVVSGSVDTNVNVNDNVCEVAQSNGILYVFNRSTLLGDNIGISIDPSALYDVTPLPLEIVDTYRLAAYTQAEIDFIANALAN